MLAIIPARGGSKGLPGKNIKHLYGQPMITYTIEAAEKSKYITDIIISTDDSEIADIAVKAGAECPFMRPKELASDTAVAMDNYIYTIERLNNERSSSVEEFIVLQPTSPLRLAADIDEAIFMFMDKKADSVISYVEESHPVVWHKYIDEQGRFENIFQETIDNRQENRVSYYPNGAIMVFKFKLIKERRYYSNNSFAYLMPRSRSIDVDSFEDFEYAEYLLEKKYAQT